MQKIIFVTGKGGVGKSTYAASLAQKYAIQGRNTLLVELGDKSFYQEFFSLSSVGYKPLPIKDRFELALWSGADCLREYALFLLKSEVLYKLFFENKVSKSLINVAPALPELAILGKITSGPRKHGPPENHEVVIVDGYATGHFLSLLRAPLGMSEIIKFGPMGEQSRSIYKTLINPEICEYHLVTLAEELPFIESLELLVELKKITGIDSKFVFNKIIETTLSSSDLQNASEDFMVYLKTVLSFQENYFQRAREEEILFSSLPLISESDPFKMVARLSQFIPGEKL